MRTICPICNEPLKEDDRLVAEWSDQMQWFVLRHYIQVTADSETVGGVKNFTARTWCGHANHSSIRDATVQMRELQQCLHAYS